MFNAESSWTAKEDVRLLDAIEQYGYGNWVDIAKHIERRTPDGERQARWAGLHWEVLLGPDLLREMHERSLAVFELCFAAIVEMDDSEFSI